MFFERQVELGKIAAGTLPLELKTIQILKYLVQLFLIFYFLNRL